MSTDSTSIQVLNEILTQARRINTEYNNILAQVHTHERQMAKDREELGKLHTRLLTMRDSTRALTSDVWRLPWDSAVSRRARAETVDIVQKLQALLDDLTWKLFDFREQSEGSRASPISCTEKHS
jgi:hypothetical protein